MLSNLSFLRDSCGRLRELCHQREAQLAALRREEDGIVQQTLSEDPEYQAALLAARPVIVLEERVREYEDRNRKVHSHIRDITVAARELHREMDGMNGQTDTEILALTSGYRAVRRHFTGDLYDFWTHFAPSLKLELEDAPPPMSDDCALAQSGIRLVRDLADAYASQKSGSDQ
jgi:hypothetical protein